MQRIQYFCPEFTGKEGYAPLITENIAAMAGVQSVETDATQGTVKVTFCEPATHRRLMNRLFTLGLAVASTTEEAVDAPANAQAENAVE